MERSRKKRISLRAHDAFSIILNYSASLNNKAIHQDKPLSLHPRHYYALKHWLWINRVGDYNKRHHKMVMVYGVAIEKER